ncbi:PaaI family thioesterase [Pseudonocardia oroxyli]|nr:PaaI family thioesterase [Pseudonocardia oroxyli]
MTTEPLAVSFRDYVASAGPDTYLPASAELRKTVPDGCFLDVMAMRLECVGRGRAQASLEVGQRHLNQAGVCQGGLVVALADATAGWAARTALPSEARFVTLTMSTNVVRAGRVGDVLWAEAVPRHLGRSTMVFESAVRRGAEVSASVVAISTVTLMVLG